MFVTAICPTFRHPIQLANSIQCWIAQDYPAHLRTLLIVDDDKVHVPSNSYNWSGDKWTVLWQMYTVPTRFKSLPSKYNYLVDKIENPGAVLVWEDDDIYLPSYVSSHVKALSGGNDFSKPGVVMSDYTGQLQIEKADGRFHSSMAFSLDLITKISGWPETKRADFDQQLISQLQKNCQGIGKPWPDDADKFQIPYIYRWHTGVAHCQSTMDRGPEDETWWDRAEQSYAKVPRQPQLIPKFDKQTENIFISLGIPTKGW